MTPAKDCAGPMDIASQIAVEWPPGDCVIDMSRRIEGPAAFTGFLRGIRVTVIDDHVHPVQENRIHSGFHLLQCFRKAGPFQPGKCFVGDDVFAIDMTG